ncbi:EF-hand domain-containing D1, partial [Brachionus plicatilis]
MIFEWKCLLSCCIVIMYLSTVQAQEQDLEFCDVQNLPADPLQLKIPRLNQTDQYQAVLERNDFGLTEEIIEFFDGAANFGVAVTTLAGEITRSYANFFYNQLLLVKGKECSVKKLNESYDLTPFQLVIDQQGNEHIISPLSLALKNLEFVYIGSSSFVRGIPVNEWQTCAFDKAKKETLKITISYSNDKKWSPAQIIPDFPSIPVQFLVESKNQDGTYKTEYFSVFKYKHGIDLEVEDYFLPSGIFCPGLANLKPLPNIPKAFSFANQLVETVEEVMDKAGKIDTIREEYDYEAKLFRFDYDKENVPMTEIHDFNT